MLFQTLQLLSFAALTREMEERETFHLLLFVLLVLRVKKSE